MQLSEAKERVISGLWEGNEQTGNISLRKENQSLVKVSLSSTRVKT